MSIKTAEFVSPMHPDKICDRIADSILDAYMAVDGESRVAVEVMGGHGLVTINGEVTCKMNQTGESSPDIEKLVKGMVGDDFRVITNIHQQSPSIARGVDTGGAGDQGIMCGYATSDTEEMMPHEYVLARDLCMKIFEKYPYDGKTQVTVEVEGGKCKVKSVVASFQNTKNEDLLALVKSIIGSEQYLINPSGEWTQGGFDADTGLSGRKLIVDNYGPEVSIGGGSFSGKDYTKVDRSGAYMARRIAVDYLKKHKAKEVYTKLAYAIGVPEPVMAVAIVVHHGQQGGDRGEMNIEGYDLSPKGIRNILKLDEVKFTQTSDWGHFGRGFEWDK